VRFSVYLKGGAHDHGLLWSYPATLLSSAFAG
jgi:hypothetical protein